MNLKTIIPISLTIIIVASVIGIILNEYPKDEEPCPPLCDYDQDELKHQLDRQNSTISADPKIYPLPYDVDSEEMRKAGYKLFPGVGWVHPNDTANVEPIYIEHPENPGEMILDLDAMIAVMEDDFELEFESLPRPAQSMDGVHNTNFTEACHSSNTIHANFTDGKVITTSDDCN